MRVVAALAGGVFLVLVIMGLSMLVRCAASDVAERWRRKRTASRAKSKERAYRDVPWTHYSRVNPYTGNYHVGIERVMDGRVINSVQIGDPIPGNDVQARIDREGEAISRAWLCNTDRQGSSRYGPVR